MNVNEIMSRLEDQGREMAALIRAVPDSEARWKPGAGRWSILEVLGHLLDEECDDFRPRIEATLAGHEWVPIDPEARVVERGHQGADVRQLLARFEAERVVSVAWLEGLGDVDWGASHEHPQLGRIRAGDLLVSWAAHDLLHMRQVVGLRLEVLRAQVAPFSVRYAAP